MSILLRKKERVDWADEPFTCEPAPEVMGNVRMIHLHRLQIIACRIMFVIYLRCETTTVSTKRLGSLPLTELQFIAQTHTLQNATG